LAALLGQFKSDGPPGLSPAHGRTIDGITIRSSILDLEGDDARLRKWALHRLTKVKARRRGVEQVYLGTA
jgi:hypothetical protein